MSLLYILICETNKDECASYPCQNHGTCHDGLASYKCSCLKGYTGSVCETNINECISNPCLNEGTCIDSVNGYTCDCASGWIGNRCQTSK